MTLPSALDPDTLLRRKATAEALTAAGFPTAEKTLATKATRGGGPPYRKYGRIPLYRWGDALAWAESRLSPPMSSSSANDVVEAKSRRLSSPVPEPYADPPSEFCDNSGP